MNYIALNQTILKKPFILMKGPRGGTKKISYKNSAGMEFWINGLHKMPHHSEISNQYNIGNYRHSNLMSGMGDGSGQINYWLIETQQEFLLIVGVKLEVDPEDFAMDIAVMSTKKNIPVDLNDSENIPRIAGELLLVHFTYLIEIEEINEYKEYIKDSESNLIKSVFEKYEINAEKLILKLKKVIE